MVIGNMMGEKSTLKQFPKRQSLLKNGNQYRYFLSSSKKILTEQPEQDVFYQKLHTLMDNGSLPIHQGPLSGRRQLQTSKSKVRSRVSIPLKTVNSLKNVESRHYHNPEPWFMR
jgi:hypothetical protein